MNLDVENKALGRLIFACLDGTANDKQIAEMEQRLKEDPKARVYYREFLMIYTGLRKSTPALLASLAAKDLRPPAQAAGPSDEKALEIERYARQQLEAFLEEEHQKAVHRSYRSSDHYVSDMLHAVISLINRWAKIAVKTAKVGLTFGIVALAGLLVFLHIRAHAVVATVTDTVDSHWQFPLKSPQLSRGWMTLNNGYARIVFTEGAQVILQAPCRIRLDSGKQLYLETGTVTAKVPRQAVGFVIATPNSTIVDFGTEFGVFVEAELGSEIHVFDGEVGVSSSRAGRRASPQQRLRQGQTALADTTGTIHVGHIGEGVRKFVRSLADVDRLNIPSLRIDLADIVGSGDGFGSGIMGGHDVSAQGTINPITGRPNDPSRPGSENANTGQYDDEHYECSNQFVPVPDLDFVDGVFVPDGGQGPTVISTAGHLFAECPDTDGQVKWNIINGWRYRLRNDATRNNDHLAEARGLSLASNIGVTFDLNAIRRSVPRAKIVRFHTRAGVPISRNPERTDVDMWVLVDGEVRFVKQDVRLAQVYDVRVPLSPEDRFLTLTVTDSQTVGRASHFSNMDWCFWEDAVLELEPN